MSDDNGNQPIPSAIYARISPTVHEKTATDLHASLDEAIKICKRDAENEGNPIVAIYIDEYVSGKDSKKMPAFQTMLKDAREQTNNAQEGDHRTSWKRIYSRRVNRFGRNRNDMIRAEIELTELGVTMKFPENGIDTAKPFGKSIMGILAELAEQDRVEILSNTKRGREYARIHGTKSGKPFGQPKKNVNVKAIRTLRLMSIKERPTWTQLEKDYKVSRLVMMKRLKEEGFWDYDKGTVK